MFLKRFYRWLTRADSAQTPETVCSTCGRSYPGQGTPYFGPKCSRGDKCCTEKVPSPFGDGMIGAIWDGPTDGITTGTWDTSPVNLAGIQAMMDQMEEESKRPGEPQQEQYLIPDAMLEELGLPPRDDDG